MKILAILGVLQGAVLIGYFWNASKNRVANRYFLGGILLSILQMLLVMYVQNPLSQNGNISLKLLTWVLVFPIPVLFHFYFRTLMGGQFKLKKWDFLHTLPTLLAILAIFPYLNLFSNPEATLINYAPTTFPRQGLYHLFFQSWVIVYYAKLNFYNIENYRQLAMKIYSNLEEKEWSWLQGAATGIFFIGFAGMVAAIIGLYQLKEGHLYLESIKEYIYWVFGVVSLSFYWVGYKAIQQPELFRHFEGLAIKKEKYSHSALAIETVQPLAEKLTNLYYGTKRESYDPKKNL